MGYMKHCKHCGYPRGDHQHGTEACPSGKRTRAGFIVWSKDTKYEPRD